ncbi:sulfite exporter TauE/SafE family protein, partial [Dietzia sp. CW19]|uniref:sulfite exporter TauE/SafE family protein n=1 Tax=Dietzia sp. CW19 TaxID=1630634 RepID=UPI001F507F51
GATSLVSLFGHARKGNVRWRTGLIFGAAGMVGAFGGGLAGGYIPGTVLMVAFAVMMIATAGAMIRGRKDRDGRSTGHHHPLWRILLDGLVVGAATGLVGAGGGFLVVPALVLLAGLPMTAAVGTSLLVIAMKSFAGLGGYLTSVSLDWPLVAAVTAAAIAGSFVGVRLTSVVPEKALRKGFGVFVLLMGAFVLSQELLFPAAPIILGAVALLALGAAVCLFFARDRCPLRSRPCDKVAGVAESYATPCSCHKPIAVDVMVATPTATAPMRLPIVQDGPSDDPTPLVDAEAPSPQAGPTRTRLDLP